MSIRKTLVFRCVELLQWGPLRSALAAGTDLVAQLARLDPALRRRLAIVADEMPVYYSCGILWWLIAAKMRWPLPDYNIYKQLTGVDERAAAIKICERYLAQKRNYTVRKQLLLLSDCSVASEEFVEALHDELDQTLNIARSAPAKDGAHFTRGGGAETLRDIQRVFSEIGERVFLISGTFLGAVRDGRFVRSEYDIDVGFFESECAIADIAAALASSERFTRVSSSEFLIKAVHVTGISVDVFAHFEDNGLLWHGSEKHRWYNTPFELAALPFEGGDYLAPTDADRYLEENYGNWREPCAFWNVSFDTPNQKFPQTKDAAFMLVNYIRSGESRFCAQRALKALRDEFGIDYTAQIPSGGSAVLRERLGSAATMVLGAFDPPTIADLEMIEYAALEGRHVIAGVGSDDTLRRKRGAAPATGQEQRCALVRALRNVAEVFVDSGYDSRRASIERFHIDRLVVPEGRANEFSELAELCEVHEFQSIANQGPLNKS